MISEAAVAASGSVAVCFVISEAAVAASGSIAVALALYLQKWQLERLGALLERSVASEAAIAAPRSVAGMFCGYRSSISKKKQQENKLQHW